MPRIKKTIIVSLAVLVSFPFFVTHVVAAEGVEPGDTKAISLPNSVENDGWNIHGQLTYVNQWHPRFTAPYAGVNSLDAAGRRANTTDVTLYLGHRLWSGAELWLNPEYDQGFGLSNTVGMAAYPSGEAYKIGQNRPYLRLPRAFIRHVISLDGEAQQVEAGAKQFANSNSANTVTNTAGRVYVEDGFDKNSY